MEGVHGVAGTHRRVTGTRTFVLAGCAVLVALVVFSSAGCGFPRDPMGTPERVREGTMHVGLVPNGPWTRMDGRPSGVEVELVESFADDLGAETA